MTKHTTTTKIVRRDAAVEGYTDHDVDIVYDGVTYISAVSYTPSAVERSSDLAPNNVEIGGILNIDTLSEADLLNGLYDGARVDIDVVDWSVQPAVKVRSLLTGFIGSVSSGDGSFTAELSSLESELAKPVGRKIELRCDADFGDTRCGFALAPVAGVVTAEVSNRIFYDSSLTHADNFFDQGKVVFATGENAGRTMDVKKYTGPDAPDDAFVELYEPMAGAIQVGDAYNIYEGCDKTEENCRANNNINRFRGFPYIPGIGVLADKPVGES